MLTSTGQIDDLSIATASPAPGIALLLVAGELNAASQDRLAAEIGAVLQTAPRAVVVDLDVVPFLGCTGPGVLDDLRRECRRRDIVLRLVSHSVATSRMLHRSGLDRVCAIAPSLPAAVDDCRHRLRRPVAARA